MTVHIVQPGKYVSLTYTIVDTDGNVVEQHDIPLGFVYGSDTQLLAGMDKAVLGRKVGDEVEVNVTPEQGFGAHDPDLTFTDDIENVPPEFRHIGAEVQMQNEAGEFKTFSVSKIEDGKLTVDANHPLAGKHLVVRVKIVNVRDAKAGEEMVSGIHASELPTHRTLN